LRKPDGMGGRLKRSLVKASMVSAVVFVCFLLMLFTMNGLLVTCLAASAFIAFAFPYADSARAKFLLGGYAIGVAMGLLGHIAYTGIQVDAAYDMALLIACCVASVFAASFLMLFLEMQHPPAAALAVAIVVDDSPYLGAVVALACILMVCGIKYMADRFVFKRENEQKAK